MSSGKFSGFAFCRVLPGRRSTLVSGERLSTSEKGLNDLSCEIFILPSICRFHGWEPPSYLDGTLREFPSRNLAPQPVLPVDLFLSLKDQSLSYIAS
jgi:hypothetical protein